MTTLIELKLERTTRQMKMQNSSKN